MNGPITTEETYHISNILKHYAHASEKHPYFCDDLLPELEHEEMRRHTKNVLTSIRKNLARHPLADWLAHRVEHLRGELKDFVNATDTETTQTTNTERTNT